ncbi:MAG: PQQ-binding-like beta-propeller repeat protein [Candidatus Hydrogenedentota bacterium]
MLEKREFEKNDFMWRVSAMLTLVAGSFSLLVFVMLVINYLQIRAADPVDNVMLTQMRIEYANLPDQDAVLAKRIQDLDLLTRKAFFTTQNHLRIGAIMLLVGITVFMVAFKNMARWRPERPQLAETPTAEYEFLAMAESRNLITWGAVILLGGGLMASYFTESALVPKADVGIAAAPGSEPEAEVVAKVFPDWDAVEKQWPTFRGAGALGQSKFDTVPTEWNVESGQNIKWKVELPRIGTNSPVIWDNRLFMTGADEEVREVYCYDTETGELLWTKTVEGLEGTPDESPQINEETGFAAPTMAVHGDQVFALFANADIVSYDFEGNQIWGYNLGLPDNHYGHSSSLLTYGNLLFVQYDQAENSELIALNAATGDDAWAMPRDEISWASPILAHTEFGPQIILASEENVDAYDPTSGKLLWREEVLGGEVAPSPAYSNGIVFAANECAMAAGIQIGGSSDAVESEVIWEYDMMLPEVSSPIGDGERFYFATSIGEIVCLDAKTGEELWMSEYDDGFYSSPVLVGDKIYISDMPGNMYIVRAGSEYELLNTIPMGDTIFATPAFLDGRIYIRTATALYCIENQDV